MRRASNRPAQPYRLKKAHSTVFLRSDNMKREGPVCRGAHPPSQTESGASSATSTADTSSAIGPSRVAPIAPSRVPFISSRWSYASLLQLAPRSSSEPMQGRSRRAGRPRRELPFRDLSVSTLIPCSTVDRRKAPRGTLTPWDQRTRATGLPFMIWAQSLTQRATGKFLKV
jgi:hypothetical protein